jgi:predicted kinase
MNPAILHVLKFFRYDHLPATLREASQPFAELADQVAHRNPNSPETTVALRKLLEAKDAAVRAALP